MKKGMDGLGEKGWSDGLEIELIGRVCVLWWVNEKEKPDRKSSQYTTNQSTHSLLPMYETNKAENGQRIPIGLRHDKRELFAQFTLQSRSQLLQKASFCVRMIAHHHGAIMRNSIQNDVMAQLSRHVKIRLDSLPFIPFILSLQPTRYRQNRHTQPLCEPENRGEDWSTFKANYGTTASCKWGIEK